MTAEASQGSFSGVDTHAAGGATFAAKKTIVDAAYRAWQGIAPGDDPADFIAGIVEHVQTDDPNELSRQLARLTCTMPMMAVANAIFQLAKDHGLTDAALGSVSEVFAYYGIEDCFELVRANFVAVDVQEGQGSDDHDLGALTDLIEGLDTLPAVAPGPDEDPDDERDTATGWGVPEDPAMDPDEEWPDDSDPDAEHPDDLT